MEGENRIEDGGLGSGTCDERWAITTHHRPEDSGPHMWFGHLAKVRLHHGKGDT